MPFIMNFNEAYTERDIHGRVYRYLRDLCYMVRHASRLVYFCVSYDIIGSNLYFRREERRESLQVRNSFMMPNA